VYEGGPTRRWLKVKQKGWTPMAAAHQHWRESLTSSRSGAGAAV
jgi:hypothetical protein